MRSLLIFLLACVLLLPTTMQAQDAAPLPITITDATGAEVTIESLDRIVSGIGDVTEIIVALGFADQLVGVDATSTYPPELLEEKTNIGFGRRLAVEAVAAAEPTVFFCSQVCGPADVLDQIRDLDIPVVIVPDTEDGGLTLPFQKIDMVAAALGVTDQAALLKERLQREIEWVEIATANVSSQPAVLHLYIRSRGLQLAGGAGTPTQYLIEGAGGLDAGKEAGVEVYVPLSPEILLTAYPDYLLLTAGSIESVGGLEAALDIQGLADTPAVQNDQIIVMDTLFLLGMSLRTGQAMMELAHHIQPDMTWELTPTYPYTYTDAASNALTVSEAAPVMVENTADLALVQQLGFHAELYQPGTELPATVIYLTRTGVEAPSGAISITLSDAPTIDELAAALNVPGRGVALKAYLGQQ